MDKLFGTVCINLPVGFVNISNLFWIKELFTDLAVVLQVFWMMMYMLCLLNIFHLPGNIISVVIVVGHWRLSPSN